MNRAQMTDAWRESHGVGPAPRTWRARTVTDEMPSVLAAGRDFPAAHPINSGRPFPGARPDVKEAGR